MSRRGARLAVAVLYAAALGAAAWHYLHAERAINSQVDSAAAFEREARAMLASIVELRASQQAYVAVGQGADYWTARVTVSIDSLGRRIAGLRTLASAEDARARLDAAAAALEDFARMDRRARDYASADQRLLASDLIFADGFDLTRAVAFSIEAARNAESIARSHQAWTARTDQRAVIAGAAGLGLLFMFILAFAPTGRTSGASRREPIRQPADDSPLDGIPARRELVPADLPAAVVDLDRAADLCLDFARVSNTQQIPALLDRAAKILDASGIVLWVADPDGRELVPTVAHGYPQSAVVRLSPIRRDADNATAAAFREGRVHIVRGDVLTGGAIVAPLAAPGGAVGVMAAEVRHEREQKPEVRAVAAIIAAQLAMLIGAAPAAQPQARAN